MHPSSNLLIEIARDFVKKKPVADLRWHYEHGFFVQVIEKLGFALPLQEFVDYGSTYIDKFILDDGTIDTYRDNEFNLDQINPGKQLFGAYARTGEKRFLTAARTLYHQLEKQPKTRSGGYWHKQIYPHQMWLDGVFMAEPFAARYVRDIDPAQGWDNVVLQFDLISAHASDPRTGLLFHAWDESREQRWCNPETGCSPHFWGRAIGWFCMALVDVWAIIPAAVGKRARLALILKGVLDAVLRLQDASGLWWQILDKPEHPRNYLETSVSAMMAYTMFRAVRIGMVDGEIYRASAQRALAGLVDRALVKTPAFSLEGTCSVAGLGGNPYRDGSLDYYFSEAVVADDCKGVAPFLLAYLEALCLTDADLAARLENYQGTSI